ncbi:cobyrinate a,c-diamide synthase, partial [bacterium]|nr:cobyrinate a,c-diamide synthase [bacterium]
MNPPRLLIAGVGGDSGKTLVTLGLIKTWRHKGINTVPFKKGPDYIDPAWLACASGSDVHNLDTWMMGNEGVLRSFTNYSKSDSINLIEGNRGLYDGEDIKGTHSSAALAKLLKLPVIVVLPVRKVTRTAAAFVLGLKLLDKDAKIAGIILNLVGGFRHESVVRRSIEDETGISVLGAIPRLKKDPLPGRHLGLITPAEYQESEHSIDVAARIISENVDCGKLVEITKQVKPIDYSTEQSENSLTSGRAVKIGYIFGSAFTFYYPENLDIFRKSNCDLIAIDPLKTDSLPLIDALYIGGGFPETHAAELSANRQFMSSVNDSAQNGLPIWAECGGLMFLAEKLLWREKEYQMAGVLKVNVVMHCKPQGHGYQEVEVDRENPFLEVGTRIRGHEFHYSQVDN